MREHLFVASNGDMYDTRTPNWSPREPLRKAYKGYFHTIANVAQLKSSLRAGPNTWPGGYSVAFLTVYNDLLCYDCVRKNFRRCVKAIRHKELGSAWQVIGCDVPDLDGQEKAECDNCDRPFT